MMYRAVALLMLVFADAAGAGAWTLDRGGMTVFTGTTASTASRRYDDDGISAKHVVFSKLAFQNWMEYGVLDSVTVFAAPEYVLAWSDMDGTDLHKVRSTSLEAGVRILLLTRIGTLSLQTSAKSAGGFDMSVSSSGESGRQFETRLLYGRGFKIFRHNAFVDVEAAKRWIARPRPNEFAFDGTAGCWITRDYLLLVQSFNFATTGPVLPPYQPYLLSKLQVSLVQKLSRRWSFQSGYFLSLAGRNIVKESGVVGTLWFQT